LEGIGVLGGEGALSRSALIKIINLLSGVSDGYASGPGLSLVPLQSPVWPSCRVATEASLAKSCNLSGLTFALIATASLADSLGNSLSQWAAFGWFCQILF